MGGWVTPSSELAVLACLRGCACARVCLVFTLPCWSHDRRDRKIKRVMREESDKRELELAGDEIGEKMGGKQMNG